MPAVQQYPHETAEEDRQARIITSGIKMEVAEQVRDLRESHGELAVQVAKLSIELEANTATTRRVEQNTAELVEAVAALKGFVKVCGWVGTAIVKLAPLAAAGAVVWGGYLAAKAAVERWWS